MTRENFYFQLQKALPRATDAEWEDIREELRAHLEDRAEALEETGLSPAEAEERALAAMGDPAEIGAALNAQLSPFWLWAGRGAKAAVVCLALVFLLAGGVRDELKSWPEIADNLRVRTGTMDPGNAWPEELYRWQSGAEMTVGEDRVRLDLVSLTPCYFRPGAYIGHLVLYTYHENPLEKPAKEILYQLTVMTESGESEGEDRNWNRDHGGWGSRGYWRRYYDLVILPEDGWIEISYDHLGYHETIHWDIPWEEAEP